MLIPMSATATQQLLDWFCDHHPTRTQRAGDSVFIDLDLARTVIDRAEAAGASIRRVRGFAVADGVARPISGQDFEPAVDALLDCETPSGASCGAARRTIRGLWASQPPASGRHMVILDFDDGRR